MLTDPKRYQCVAENGEHRTLTQTDEVKVLNKVKAKCSEWDPVSQAVSINKPQTDSDFVHARHCPREECEVSQWLVLWSKRLENAQPKVDGRQTEVGGHFHPPPAENETPE